MKISWTSLKISIAGAKLSHLVQQDKIWDHGSMAEQARIIFYLVYKAKGGGNVDLLKRHCTISCFEKIETEMNKKGNEILLKEPVIKELAVMEVSPGRKNRPDRFTAFISGIAKNNSNIEKEKEFSSEWSFTRQGEWWLLDDIK